MKRHLSSYLYSPQCFIRPHAGTVTAVLAEGITPAGRRTCFVSVEFLSHWGTSWTNGSMTLNLFLPDRSDLISRTLLGMLAVC